MSAEILGLIKTALAGAGSPATPLLPTNAEAIVNNAKAKFVVGNPRAWWMSLKGTPKLYDSEKYNLEDVIPSRAQSYWFIPETEEENLTVFELTIPEISAVLKDCPFFEYYVIEKTYRWLIAESDHNQFHIV